MSKQIKWHEVQSYLDSELDPNRRREVDAFLASDAQAAELAKELAWTRGTLRQSEPIARFPIRPEFYWGGIERGIRAAESAAPAALEAKSSRRMLANWLKWLVPVAGSVCVLMLLMRDPSAPEIGDAVFESSTEIAQAGVSAINFRSDSAGMTVVWLRQARE